MKLVEFESSEALFGRVRRVVDDRTRRILELVKPDRGIWKRLCEDAYAEKAAIASYVARAELGPETRAFLMASSAVVHLANCICQLNPTRSVFATNGVLVPLVLQREHSSFEVKVLSGPMYDEMCGAFLLPMKTAAERNAASQRLETFFKESESPLDTVIISPMAIDSHGLPWFVREEAAYLAGQLMGLARRVLLLVPGDRMYVDLKDLPIACFPALPDNDRDSVAERLTIIVSGRPNSGSADDVIAGFDSEVRNKITWHIEHERDWPDKPTDSLWEETPFSALLLQRKRYIRNPSERVKLHRVIERIMEMESILDAVKNADGAERAAEQIGINRSNLYQKMSKVGIELRRCKETGFKLPRLIADSYLIRWSDDRRDVYVAEPSVRQMLIDLLVEQGIPRSELEQHQAADKG